MLQIPVTERSEVAEARRQCVSVAHAVGFDETDAGRVALVASELATNLMRHAGSGEILCGPFSDETGSGVEILSLDRGPGLRDVEACMRDGYSTGGSSGHGLGAIRRQSQVFEIATKPQQGTVILSRVTPGRVPNEPPPLPLWGGIAVPKPGEDVCGDAFAAARLSDGVVVMVADGLGHGPDASLASTEAARVFNRYHQDPVAVILETVHNALRPTRGAAVSIARLSHKGMVTFAGIGNVAGILGNGQEGRRMVSMNGTAGHNARRIQTFDYPLPSGIVILHSDGLGGSWPYEAYQAYAHRHPTLIAGLIFRDQARGRDDATVLVARQVAQA